MQKTEIVIEAAKVAPAMPVTVMSFLGYSVADWASIATLIYSVLLISHFIGRKLIKPKQGQRPSDKA